MINKSKKNILRLLSAQRGLTLIELLITISILAVVGSAGLALFSSSYKTVLYTGERIQQINRGGQILGALNALLVHTDPRDLGIVVPSPGLPALSGPGGATIPSTPAGLLPPSLSGNQMTFATGGRCYRVFYRQQVLWLAVASSCNNLAQPGIVLQRGPGQFPTTTFTSSSALYDPVLDLTKGQQRVVNSQFTAYQLATKIEPLAGRPLFSYKFFDLSAVATSASGDLGDNLPFYTAGDYAAGEGARASIAAIEVSFRVLADNPEVSAKEYQQLLFIDQPPPESAG